MLSGHRLISEARRRRGMTQIDVGLMCGASERQIRRWESGEQPVPFNVVRNIVIQCCGLDFIELQKELADADIKNHPRRFETVGSSAG